MALRLRLWQKIVRFIGRLYSHCIAHFQQEPETNWEPGLGPSPASRKTDSLGTFWTRYVIG